MQNETHTPEQQTVALQVREAALLPAEQWPDLRIRSIIKTVAPDNASVADIAMFLAVAQRYDLDPLIKEIWLAEDKGKLIVITGKDAILKKAREHPLYLGHVSGLVHENDEFQLEQLPDDEVRITHKIVGFPRGKLVGAYCVVRQKDRPPIWIVRELEDYAHLFRKQNWSNYKPDMFLTRVVTAAHRLAFSLSGLYTPEDFIAGELRPDEGEFADEDRPQRQQGVGSVLDRARAAQQGRDVTAVQSQETLHAEEQKPAAEDADYEIVQDEPEAGENAGPDTPGSPQDQVGAARSTEGKASPARGDDPHTRQLDEMKRKIAEAEAADAPPAVCESCKMDPHHPNCPEKPAPDPVGAMMNAAKNGAEKRAARKGARTGKTRDELNREYHAKVGEVTEWGDVERKLWQEQRVGKASCKDWGLEDYELALLLLGRGELEYQPPLIDHADPEAMPV